MSSKSVQLDFTITNLRGAALQRAYSFTLEILLGHFMPYSKRSLGQWKDSDDFIAVSVSDQVPDLHSNTDITNAL